MKLIWKLVQLINGWTSPRPFASHLPKCIIVVGPHTSSTDVFLGMMFRNLENMQNAHFLAKKELFEGPFGWFFKLVGGLPVDRNSKTNTVDQVAEMFAANERLVIAMSPEGTRKRVDKLKTGFYYIAKKAKVPLVLAALDFEKKQCVFSDPFYTTDDEHADFKKIIDYLGSVKGKVPELDLRHLKEEWNKTNGNKQTE